MKPSNESLLMIYANAFSAAALLLDEDYKVAGHAEYVVAMTIKYAATLPDESSSNPLQLDDHIVDDNKKVATFRQDAFSGAVAEVETAVSNYEFERKPPREDAPQFEVGGTCDQGVIVFVSDKNTYRYLVVKSGINDAPGWYEASGITNYKPPVRVPAWCARNGNTCIVTNSYAEANQFGLMEYGYWTPKVGA